MQTEAYISLNRITKVFHTGGGSFTALDNISLKFDHGEFVSVVGKSGSGKSTLMNMITGIDRPTRGEVCIDGKAIHLMPETELARWRGKNLGIVFQFYQLLPVLTLKENVMLPMEITGEFSSKACEEKALLLLEQVDLLHQADKLPDEVAGGQQQSAAIARALVNDPPILIADEPTGNLDSNSADQIIQLFERFSSQGKTIIMVTHDPDLANRALRKVRLSDGIVLDDKDADPVQEDLTEEVIPMAGRGFLDFFRRKKS